MAEAPPKTLEDALAGLLRYWKLRPNGGTRAELIQLAIAQGFVEPLLNEWLDIFLQGFVNMGWIASSDYDRELAPRVRAVGYDIAARNADAVFRLLTDGGAGLDVIRKQNAIAAIDAELLTTRANLDDLSFAVAALRANPAFRGRDLLAIAGDEGVLQLQHAIESMTNQRDLILAQIG